MRGVTVWLWLSLSGASVATDYHPLPRVIVDVRQAVGARSAEDVQRVLRAQLWSGVVSCYDERRERDTFGIELDIDTAGFVGESRVVREDRWDGAVARCVAKRAEWIRFGVCPAGSTRAVVRIRVAPGDSPKGKGSQ